MLLDRWSDTKISEKLLIMTAVQNYQYWQWKIYMKMFSRSHIFWSILMFIFPVIFWLNSATGRVVLIVTVSVIHVCDPCMCDPCVDQEIRERMPADPFEAEMLMMAEAVATEGKTTDSESSEESDDDAPEGIAASLLLSVTCTAGLVFFYYVWISPW